MAKGGTTHQHEEMEGAAERVHDSDEYKLAHHFYDVYTAYRKIVNAEGPPVAEEDLEALVNKLKAIASRVIQLRLFSPNEELDDISTADLKFLLVPYLLAEVTGATRNMSTRLESLKRAILYWRAFGNDCDRLKIAHIDDMKAINRNPEETFDPNTKRDEKIARYKRTKVLDEKVAFLFAKKREVLGDEYQWGHGGSFDEDMERDLVLSLIGRACASVAENIASAEQELPLLEMMMAHGGLDAPPPEKPPPPSKKPFILRIQDKAELMRIYKEMVFQCPYERPTMTLAECASIETAQMQEREAARADHDRRRQAYEDERWYQGDRLGSREEEEEDQKTYKDRDWDDWKDEHPWGSGNKMANIG